MSRPHDSALKRALRSQWHNLYALYFAAVLKRRKQCYFSHDDFSRAIPVWENIFRPSKGRSGLRFLEIGSNEGRSALWLLKNVLTHPSASITCVDPFARRGLEQTFDHNIRVSGVSDKVTKIKGRSEEVLTTFAGRTFDAVYIDGAHLACNVLMDALASWLLLKPKSIIIFDDYEWHPERPPHTTPKLAIDIFLNLLANDIAVLHRGYQVIVEKQPRETRVDAEPLRGRDV